MSLGEDATLKERLHHGIRHAFSNVLTEYYSNHLELLDNKEALERATYKLFKLMDIMLAHLNEVEFDELEKKIQDFNNDLLNKKLDK
jgi:hypothetical protein